MGDSLQEITADLAMPYETVKTYAKLPNRSAQEIAAASGKQE